MHSAGRDAPGRWERINKARAQARHSTQQGGAVASANSDDDEEEDEVEEQTEPEEQEPALISAAGDVSVGDLIEVRDKLPDSEAWYAAKVLSSSTKGVKVHFIGWKSSYDELIRPTSGRLRQKQGETPTAKPGALAKTALKQGKQGRGTTKTIEAGTKPRAVKGKGAAATKTRKRKKTGDDDKDWEAKPVKKESVATSARGRKRKTVSYAESGSDSNSDSDASSVSDNESTSDEDYDDDEAEEIFVKATLPDGTPLPIEWDGIDLSGSKLHSTAWGRVILDEAHKIKGARQSINWCPSGM
jgi:hypothetical protein